MTGNALSVGVRPLLVPGFDALAKLKFVFEIRNDCVVIAVASLQFAENSFQIIKLSGHPDSPKNV
jgi:hypothetical protein